MASGPNPAADNTPEFQLAEVVRRLTALERNVSSGGFQSGDYIDSEVVHPDFVPGVFSDGGRPGWYLANGATNASMATTDPMLYELLGNSTTLPDYRDKWRAPAGGTVLTARGTVVGVSGVTLSTANLPSHSHPGSALTVTGAPGVGTLALTGAPGGTFASSGHTHTFSGTTSGTSGTTTFFPSGSTPATETGHTHTYSGTTSGPSATASPTVGTLAMTGAPSIGTLDVGGSTGNTGSGTSFSTLPPTRACGATWIKR